MKTPKLKCVKKKSLVCQTANVNNMQGNSEPVSRPRECILYSGNNCFLQSRPGWLYSWCRHDSILFAWCHKNQLAEIKISRVHHCTKWLIRFWWSWHDFYDQHRTNCIWFTCWRDNFFSIKHFCFWCVFLEFFFSCCFFFLNFFEFKIILSFIPCLAKCFNVLGCNKRGRMEACRFRYWQQC